MAVIQDDCENIEFLDENLINSTSSSQESDEAGDYKSRIVRYRRKIKTLKEQIDRQKKKEEKNKDRDILSDIFNDDQIEHLITGSSRGRFWSDKTVQTAIQLKFACGETGYSLLLKNKLPYPSLRTLRDRLSSLKFESGVLSEMFEFLKIKVATYKEHHKICALSFDEMSIVPGRQYDNSTDKMYGNVTFPDKSFDSAKANHSLVFMLAGVAGRWKQIVASYFTGM